MGPQWHFCMCAAYINLPCPFISNPTSPWFCLFHFQTDCFPYTRELCNVCLHVADFATYDVFWFQTFCCKCISFFLCGWLVLCCVHTTFKNSIYMVLHSWWDVIPGCYQATLRQQPWVLLTPDKSSLCTSRPCGNCTEELFPWCKAGVKEACRRAVTTNVDEGLF